MLNIETSLDDGVLEIVLNRPDRLNALVPELMLQIAPEPACQPRPFG